MVVVYITRRKRKRPIIIKFHGQRMPLDRCALALEIGWYNPKTAKLRRYFK